MTLKTDWSSVAGRMWTTTQQTWHLKAGRSTTGKARLTTVASNWYVKQLLSVCWDQPVSPQDKNYTLLFSPRETVLTTEVSQRMAYRTSCCELACWSLQSCQMSKEHIIHVLRFDSFRQQLKTTLFSDHQCFQKKCRSSAVAWWSQNLVYICVFCNVICVFCDVICVFCNVICVFCDVICVFCNVICVFCNVILVCICVFCDVILVCIYVYFVMLYCYRRWSRTTVYWRTGLSWWRCDHM